jgi:hypothetical protein
MSINPLIPVAQGGGYWKMERKKETQARRQEFIVSVMKRIVEKGTVVLTADPDRIPSKVFQHAEMGEFKSNGKWYLSLDIETQKVMIGLKYSDYQTQDRNDAQVYMAVRIDLEKMIDLYDNLALKT